MLARAADSLYWLARYMERMDNIARLVDAAQAMADIDDGGGEWTSALIASGASAAFYAAGHEATAHAVVNFLTRDPENPSSILSCLERARSNAKAMRTALTRDMWDTVNAAWLEGHALAPEAFDADRLADTLDWVRAIGTRFHGAYEGTMLRNEIYWFTRLGTFVERFDNTARILDVKYHVLLPRDEGVGGAVDYYQWTSVLRAVSAVRAYHWVYRSEVKPWNVAELLMLRPEMPRSLRACADAIEGALDSIAQAHAGRRGECHRIAGSMAAELRYGRIDDIYQGGLHEYLTRAVERTERLGVQIGAFYMR